MILEKNILSKSECDLFIKKSTLKGFKSSLIGEGVENANIRTSYEVNLDIDDVIGNLLLDKLNEFNIISLPAYLKVIKYTKGSFFKKHKDTYDDIKNRKRYKTMVVQLSPATDYRGGDLKVFTNSNEGEYSVVSRQQGSVSIFPSDYTHEVLKITNGIRYTIVMWLESDNFNGNKKILI